MAAVIVGRCARPVVGLLSRSKRSTGPLATVHQLCCQRSGRTSQHLVDRVLSFDLEVARDLALALFDAPAQAT